LPITGIGFDAAVGLLVSTVAQQRTYVVLTQIMVILARVLVAGLLLYGLTRFVNGSLETSDAGAWLLTGGFAALGDWGLRFLNLGFYGEIWATVSYGVFLGLGLLVFAMVEAALTDGILALAARRAQKKG
ncbi:MAG: hypothetical protein H7175_26260, partial [Burkholderiales bacterium]|nr:hypothetical protein [Anaerolineae bacterium]